MLFPVAFFKFPSICLAVPCPSWFQSIIYSFFYCAGTQWKNRAEVENELLAIWLVSCCFINFNTLGSICSVVIVLRSTNKVINLPGVYCCIVVEVCMQTCTMEIGPLQIAIVAWFQQCPECLLRSNSSCLFVSLLSVCLDHYSTVTLLFSSSSSGCLLKLKQVNVPTSSAESTKEGWHRYYFESIKMTFGFGASLMWMSC